MTEERQKVLAAAKIPFVFVTLITFIKLFEIISGYSFTELGIYPGAASGLAGIVLSPLIHADFQHLFSNVIPLLVLGFGLFYFYPASALKVIIGVYPLTNFLVWLFGRTSYHIGASGIVYGLASFIFFSGVIKRDTRSITLSLLVTFIYGGMVWGVLPVKEGISWESHLFGALTGFLCALIFRKKDRFKKYDWEDEESDIPPEKLEIRHDR